MKTSAVQMHTPRRFFFFFFFFLPLLHLPGSTSLKSSSARGCTSHVGAAAGAPRHQLFTHLQPSRSPGPPERHRVNVDAPVQPLAHDGGHARAQVEPVHHSAAAQAQREKVVAVAAWRGRGKVLRRAEKKMMRDKKKGKVLQENLRWT